MNKFPIAFMLVAILLGFGATPTAIAQQDGESDESTPSAKVAPPGPEQAQSAATSAEPVVYPLEYFALREVVNNVSVSPDGERLAMLRILTRTGNPILHVYDTDNVEPDADPFTVDADPMEILSYGWASDTHIVMNFRQKVRDRVEGQEASVYEYRLAVLDVENEDFADFRTEGAPFIENLLPGRPNEIIISDQPGLDDSVGVREAFRPRAYYTLNLDRGTRSLLIRGRLTVGRITFDGEGNPRFALGYDPQRSEYVAYYRDVGERDWRDVYRWTNDDFKLWRESVIGLDDEAPGNLLMRAFNGDDKLGLWSYNTTTREFEELIYRRSDVDVYGVRYHSNDWMHPDRVAAVSYYKDNFHFEYFDEVEEATYAQLEQLIPHAFYITIQSRSRDGNTVVVRNIGPRDPGTYYLLREGRIESVGSHQPLLDSEQLADIEYIPYTARDGREMAAFITIPNRGEPPYPTVVMPHGGPHVLEVVLYDEWAQMLANNGYLVVQPQYRMSHGYGLDHFLTAFINGSEAGRKMQDDKDDAALHLVEMGLADPDRLAMYGWSYGGYAALVAAARTPQIYQCTIAGAAVSDYITAAIDGFGAGAVSGTGKVWKEVYEYGAVQPAREPEKVNVPILLIHGSVDSRVLPKQAQLYRDALDTAGKEYKYVELDGAGHFYNTLYFDHQIELYTSIIDFLKNDCGNMSVGAGGHVAGTAP